MDYQKSLITTGGIEVRHVKPAKNRRSKTAQLYVSRNGAGYSHSGRGLCPLVSAVVDSRKKILSESSRWGGDLVLTSYNMLVNRAVWTAWNPYGYDAIPKGFQIHHLNGNKYDNDIENLVCLSPKEHKHWEYRAKMIKAKLGSLRVIPYANLHAMQAMPRIELQYYLDHYQHVDPEDRMNYEITHHVEFLEH